jgi:hypothetical protein
MEVIQQMAYEAQDRAFLCLSYSSFDTPPVLDTNHRIATAAPSTSIYWQLRSSLENQYLRPSRGQRIVFSDFTRLQHVHAAAISAYEETD